MGIKLCNFFIFCHVVIAFGSLIPNQTSNQLGFLNHLSPFHKNIPINNHSNSDIQKNNKDKQRHTDIEITGSETTVTINKSHEEPVNIKLITTETTSTSEKAHNTVTEPNNVRQCPEGQSSISKKDLNDMIIYIATTNKLIETIHESYFEHATSVRDKHLKTKNDFLTRFQNRPTHLKHILDDMNQMINLQIVPFVQEVITKKPEITSLQIKHSENVNNSNMQLEKYEKYRQICALNCDTTEFVLRRKRSLSERPSPSRSFNLSEEVYYCSTLKEVKNKIDVVLSQFKDEHILFLQNTINEIDAEYEEDIEQLKTALKEAAVQEFGSTMYDVLSLEDEYYHFLRFLKGKYELNVFESQIRDIRKSNMRIDYITEELNNYLEKYRKHCLSCDKRQQRYQRHVLQEHLVPLKRTTTLALHKEPTNYVKSTVPTQGMSTESTTDVSPTEPTNDVLEDLISIYIDKIKIKFQTELHNLFEELNDLLNDKGKIIKNALVDLQPIQSEIIENLKKEEQILNALKTQAPESELNDLKKINENSVNLQNKLEEALKFIQGTVKI